VTRGGRPHVHSTWACVHEASSVVPVSPRREAAAVQHPVGIYMAIGPFGHPGSVGASTTVFATKSTLPRRLLAQWRRALFAGSPRSREVLVTTSFSVAGFPARRRAIAGLCSSTGEGLTASRTSHALDRTSPTGRQTSAAEQHSGLTGWLGRRAQLSPTQVRSRLRLS
jgi:hypothetical protein